MSMRCQVSYIVQYARGGTSGISQMGSKDVKINVIGGPISGDNDKSYFCSSNDTSGFGNLSATSGQPTGTTYSWSISGSAIYCDSDGNSTSPIGASAVYRGVKPGSTNPGDVKANVTYSLNGVSAKSSDFPITIHVPVSFAITSQTGPTKLLPPDPNAYGFDGQSITFRVLDGLGLPLTGAYWDESWSQPNGGGQPSGTGGPLDRQGYSTDSFSFSGANQPSNPNGDKVYGPLTHAYSVTNTGGTGGNVGCPVKTYTNVYYYTSGMTGNGF